MGIDSLQLERQLERGLERELERRPVGRRDFRADLVSGLSSLDGPEEQLREPAPTLDSCIPGWAFYNRREGKVVPFRCGSWRCRECAPKRAVRLAERIRSEAVEKGCTRLLTLTLRAGRVPRRQSADYIWASWRRLRDVWRHRGWSVSAIAVLEYTQRGTAHLHVLVSHYLDQRRLSADWKAATRGSYIVHVQQVDEQRVSAYVTKYLSKALDTGSEHPKGRRRYSSSRDVCLSLRRRPTGDWTVVEYVGDVECLSTPLDPEWQALAVRVRAGPGGSTIVASYVP